MADINLAVLIDADNVPYSNIRGIMKETTKSGTPTIKRIYGDFTNQRLNGWKEVLLENAITPIQQYAYTTGKNATDSALIIDAMDILHREHVDGFCIVSSDSDYTRLVTRIREAGKLVIGIGEKKTPKPFIAACNKFIYIEIIEDASESEEKENIQKIDKAFISTLKQIVDDVADESGWAFLGDVGNYLSRREPDFDSRNYGFKKLTTLIGSLKKDFELDIRIAEGRKGSKNIFVKIKEDKTTKR